MTSPVMEAVVPHLVPTQPARPALSTREVEVLLAWMAAESKEDAAHKLFISQSTVSTHISRIRAKYAAVGRCAPTKAHLLARALQDGYTTLEEW
ncbi:response regulator transcription factor [Gordonia neofelifaecis]|nr:LuxR C-terminal-related transcriptional regulator [Gordonia neofelifaecis]